MWYGYMSLYYHRMASVLYIQWPIGYSDASCVFDVGCVGGGIGSDRVIQG